MYQCHHNNSITGSDYAAQTFISGKTPNHSSVTDSDQKCAFRLWLGCSSLRRENEWLLWSVRSRQGAVRSPHVPSYGTGRICPTAPPPAARLTAHHPASPLPAPRKATRCSSRPPPLPRENWGSIPLTLVCHWETFPFSACGGLMLAVRTKICGQWGKEGEFVVRASVSRKSQYLPFSAAPGFLCNSGDVIWSLSPSVERRRVITSFSTHYTYPISLQKVINSWGQGIALLCF